MTVIADAEDNGSDPAEWRRPGTCRLMPFRQPRPLTVELIYQEAPVSVCWSRFTMAAQQVLQKGHPATESAASPAEGTERRPPRGSLRRTSNAVMITAAVLMVISLAFVSRAYSARRPKPWASFLVRFRSAAAIE